MQHTPINISLYTPIRRLVYHHCHYVLIMYHWTEKSFLCLMVQNIYEKSNFSLMRVAYLDKKVITIAVHLFLFWNGGCRCLVRCSKRQKIPKPQLIDSICLTPFHAEEDFNCWRELKVKLNLNASCQAARRSNVTAR